MITVCFLQISLTIQRLGSLKLELEEEDPALLVPQKDRNGVSDKQELVCDIASGIGLIIKRSPLSEACLIHGIFVVCGWPLRLLALTCLSGAEGAGNFVFFPFIFFHFL